MNTNSKLKIFVLRITVIVVLFSIPIFQDYNSRNFPKYEIVDYKVYIIQSGDTLSEIAESYRPEHMKLSNYIVEIQCANSINIDIAAGEKILIPVEELK